jgi:NAD-dependent dihydropyrimidine dehydrogenase PreA subunit
MEAELKDYLGIPRRLIPWFPSINEGKCTGCSTCAKACKHEVYSLDNEKKRSFVANPFSCEVFCQSCQFQCNQEAISFPKKADIKEIIKGLRVQYPPR